MAALRVGYVVVMLAVLVVAVARRRTEIAGLVAHARPAWLAAALALTFGQLWLSSVWWSSALRGLGSPAAAGAVLRATVRSLPARYLPGSIWYPLGRAALLASQGVRKSALATVAVLEIAISVVVAFAIGGLVLAMVGLPPAGSAAVTVACIGLLVGASPPVLNPVLGWIAARRGITAPQLDWGAYARLLGWMAAFWVLSALAFTIYLHAFPEVAVRQPLTVAGAFLVAWGVGTLAVFAPQGLGVFEVTLAALLVGRPAVGTAVVIAGFRALVAVRDAIAFSAGALGGLRRPPGDAGSPPTGE
jgi:glycosyltransferase 2 family protein